MSNLLPFLKSRLQQLEDRRMMIPRYVKRSGSFAGKKDFSLDMLPQIEKDIGETIIAIGAIEALRELEQYKAKQKKRDSILS